MYSSYSTYDPSMLFIFLFIFTCLYFAAFIVSMLIVVEIAKTKGYDDLVGKLWFIGLFGLIFTPAIIVAALPNKSQSINEPSDADLPKL